MLLGTGKYAMWVVCYVEYAPNVLYIDWYAANYNFFFIYKFSTVKLFYALTVLTIQNINSQMSIKNTNI